MLVENPGPGNTLRAAAAATTTALPPIEAGHKSKKEVRTRFDAH